MSVEKRSGGNQRVITTMLPINMTPKPAPTSTRPVSSTGQLGAVVKMMPPMVASTSMAVTVRRGPKRSKKKPQGICIAAKPKKNAPVSAPSASGPIDRSRIRSRPIVTLEERKKWLAIYAVASVATMMRPPRMTDGRRSKGCIVGVSSRWCCCALRLLWAEPMRARYAVQGRRRPRGRRTPAIMASPYGENWHYETDALYRCGIPAWPLPHIEKIVGHLSVAAPRADRLVGRPLSLCRSGPRHLANGGPVERRAAAAGVDEQGSPDQGLCRTHRALARHFRGA